MMTVHLANQMQKFHRDATFTRCWFTSSACKRRHDYEIQCSCGERFSSGSQRGVARRFTAHFTGATQE